MNPQPPPPAINNGPGLQPPFSECVSHGSENERAPSSRNLAEHLQGLLEQIQAQPNPAARALLQDCLQSLLTFYGEGLSRIVHHLQSNDGDAGQILERVLAEPTVSSLLLIHGLHPVPLETRLRAALEKVRPYMQRHGGSIELLSLDNEVAHVQLTGTCKSCPSSAVTLELAVRRAVEEACPDLVAFEVVQAKGEPTGHETLEAPAPSVVPQAT